MAALEDIFENLLHDKRKAFIPYIMAGYPDKNLCLELVKLMAIHADILEIGIPFSDPIADGPTIQEAGQVALSHGMSLRKVVKFLHELKGDLEVPLILMSYYNPIYRYGITKFLADIKETDVAGIIIPDLPPEEAGEWIASARRHGVATIFLLTPTSTEGRIQYVGTVSKGFVYYVSTTGTTGAGTGQITEIGANVQRIKEITGLPVVVGFGISSRQEAADIATVSDGVVVGSALIRRIEEARQNGHLLEEATDFLASMKDAIKQMSG